ncbi:MAG: hypothetical protein EA423_09420 [Phycisphaerales bacterium]|nr:MAG: hypothetical protein EA423_09420 [Phycisphaerales bacterium]
MSRDRTPLRARIGAALRVAPAALCAMAILSCANDSEPGRLSANASPPETAPFAFDPVESEEAWTHSGIRGRMITTAGYRIYTTESSTLLLRRIPVFLELAMERYTQISGLSRPDRRLETYVLASRPQWAALTRQFTGERASTYLQIRAGGFAEGGRALLFDIGSRGTFAVAAHEGWHQFTQSVLRNPLPIWLEEGLGAYMEGYRWNPSAPEQPIFLPWSNVERFDRLRDLVSAGRFVPLPELLVRRPQDLLTAYSNEDALDYYAQVWALAHMFFEGDGGRYAPGLRRLIADAASGDLYREITEKSGRRAAQIYASRRTGSTVFELYFDSDLEGASRLYEAFVAEIVSTGGRDRIVAGQSPIGR